MANYERGSDDVRVFDGAEDDEDVEGARLPLLIVIALLVLAAFGAVVYLAYQKGVAQGSASVPRVIAAQPGPAKVAPANAGGTPTPYTGLKIYQQPAPSDEEANADTAPPPPPDVTPTKPAPPRRAPKPGEPPPPPAAKPAPVVAKPAPVAVAPPPPVVKPTPAPVKPPVETPVAIPAPVPAATGGALLQLGSYKSEADANTAWRDYKAKHPAVAGLSPDFKTVDLGAKGTWVRLRVVAGGKSE